ncbi:MAG: glycosyltransferase [Rhizobiales bacterium]|nr:glycosyltransferase [Hyphomicrobiales bacterium]
MPRKKIVILTDIPVHSMGLGSIARMQVLLEYLSPSVETHCIILGQDEVQPPQIGSATLHFLPPDARGNIDPSRIRQLIAKLKPDIGMIVYAPLAKTTRALFPPKIPMIIDSHDLLYLRADSFRAAGLAPIMPMDEADEFAVLDTFDRVLLISKMEMELAIPLLGKKKCLFSPHVAPDRDVPLTPSPVGGILSSAATANRHGLKWLHDQVLQEGDLAAHPLRICGSISNMPKVADEFPRFDFLPFVESTAQFYETISFTMNPTHIAGGMKIKSVEAFGYGIPLITTPEGIDGCPPVDYEFCRVAKTASDFRNAILEVAASEDYRHHLRAGALRYAREQLSPDAAFGSLIRYIQKA